MVRERAYWLAWSQIYGIGPVLLFRLHRHFGSLAQAWAAPGSALGEVEGFGRQTVEKAVRLRSQIQPEKLLEEHLQKNPHFWTPADGGYPRLLLEIANPPPLLYYRGQVEVLENHGITPMVAIVGTRTPSDYGRRWARRLSAVLASRGFTIVSGMAAGIDAEAHRACLDAGRRTLAVLGTGTDVVYPLENRKLYERILEGGLVLSEHPAGTPPKGSHFPQRNRIIAGLCRAVLVVEAPAKSGALITADLANDFCRDVYALPGRVDDYNSQGCLRLLKNGAEMIVSEEALLEMLGAMPPVDAPQQLSLFEGMPSTTEAPPPPVRKGGLEERVSAPQLPPDLARVLRAVPAEPIPFDLIVLESGLPAASVSSALLQLELLGLVSQLPGMRYQRC